MLSLLPLVYALIATLVQWRSLKNPRLFFAVAILVGLGAQSLAELLPIAWSATYDQFIATRVIETSEFLASAPEVITAIIIVTPVYWLLGKRL